VHPLGGRPLTLGSLEVQLDVYAPDDEDLVVRLFDFTDRLAREAVAVGPDVARLQRASEGPCQSTGGGCDDVVKCGGMRLEGPRDNFVVLGYGSVDAEDNRLRLTREIGSTDGALDALDPHLGAVHDTGHGLPTLLNEVLKEASSEC
jgi:hypothetical protein